MNPFQKIVLASRFYISKTWKQTFGDFLEEEHLNTLANTLWNYFQDNNPLVLEFPMFNEEIKADSTQVYSYFEAAWNQLKNSNFEVNETNAKQLAQSIENTPFQLLLLAIGQRLTSASIQDERAIPPKKEAIIKASFQPHNHQISKVVRAWEKHIQRNSGAFWGTISGTPKEKEVAVFDKLNYILDHKTWWNVFYHYKHELVYEVRIPEGHGIRWKKEDGTLIGFLEPFEN